MRQYLRLGFVIATLSAVLAAPGSADAQPYPLADMIRETKVALLRVQEKAEAQNLPPLSSAVLELNTVQAVDASGSIKLLVIEIGGGPATEASTTVKLTLTPPAPGTGTDVAAGAPTLADGLAEAILAAARSLNEASKGKPPLIVSGLSVAVKFGIVRSANGGLALQFPPFEVRAGAKIKASEIQTVTVSYAARGAK
jgi:hypothetical protein